MRFQFAALVRLLASAGLLVTLCGPAPRAAAAEAPAWPPHVQPVPYPGGPLGDPSPIGLQPAPVQVVIHVDLPPLMAVGKYWTHAQRAAYMAQLSAAQDALSAQVASLGGEVVGRLNYLTAGLAVNIDAAQIASLNALADVAAVTSVANYTLEEDPPVPGPTVDSSGEPHAWNDLLTLPGRGVDIAIIDTGVDYTHIKLGGSGLPATYTACAANAATIGDCPDYPNAKVVGGWDWMGEVWPDPDPRCGVDAAGLPQTCLQPDPDPIDLQGHGTHVADIAGGLWSRPGALDFGVAPGSRLWAFKACSAQTGLCNGLALVLALDDAMDLDNSDQGACTPGVDAGCAVYDPAAVVNLSIGTAYGQPEETLSHMVNLAAYYGAVVVAAAGNGGDRPYVISAPSTADGAISVGQTTLPWNKLYRLQVGPVTVNGLYQTWSPPITGPLTGAIQYGDGAGGNLNGCAPLAAGSLAGKALLVDRGVCAASLKAANGSAAGAVLVLVADTKPANTPGAFGYGGGEVLAPVLTLTLADGQALKGLIGAGVSTTHSDFICFDDDLAATSSRGPRIADGGIKPDLVAPGGKRSAVAGSGSAIVEFGGTSSAAPLVAGSAALVIQALQARQLWAPADPGVGAVGISVAPLVKALLMNSAETETTIGGHFYAPITLQGAGRLNPLGALFAKGAALDVTQLYDWSAAQTELPCALTSSPTNGLALAMPPAYYNGSYKCLSQYPFGNDFFNAWNAQAGSLSFGYAAVTASGGQTRKLLVINLTDTPHTYEVESEFRYANDTLGEVTLSVSPAEFTLAGRGSAVVDVTLHLNAKGLRPWTLDSGAGGASGTRLDCAAAACPSLTEQEYDGFLKIEQDEPEAADEPDQAPSHRHFSGESDHDFDNVETLSLPWQVLPKRAAQVQVARVDAASVKLRNAGAYETGEANVFALLQVSPNKCEIINGATGTCLEQNYQPGVVPGINGSFIDLHEIGLRSYSVPGANAYFGLPPAPAGALADEIIDFALTVYDKPYRASHNYPVAFNIYVDADSDSVLDYVVFNADLALDGSDGRSAVFVRDINVVDGTHPTRAYFFSATDFNSQNWILPVPAAALGARSDHPLRVLVTVYDAYFSTGGSVSQDCSPSDCTSTHQVQTGWLKYQPDAPALFVPPLALATLLYDRPAGGAAASPAQIGLLFLYWTAPVGAESDSVVLP